MDFSEDLHLFAGTLGGKTLFCGFDDEDVRDSFQRTDFKLMRTTAFSNQTLWNTLMERPIPRVDREGAERYVCKLLGDNGRCGLIFAGTGTAQGVSTLEPFMAKQICDEVRFCRLDKT